VKRIAHLLIAFEQQEARMYLHIRLRPAFALSLIVFLCLIPYANTRAQSDERCFPETNYCISGRIREFWEQNGGLPIFGFPIGPQQAETVEGKSFQAQWFERNRLELHPENAAPYDVLLGRLGVDRLVQQGRDWFGFPKSQPHEGCLFFEATGHSLCPTFLGYWQANGLEFDGLSGKSQDESLALFGMPISEPQAETLSDGRSYIVQWFERARFEMHPENQPPYDILLGLLGNETRGSANSPPPPPSPTPETTPPAPIIAPVTVFAPSPDPSKAIVRVTNSTDAPLTSELKGPTNGSWPVAPGQTLEEQVQPGTYQITTSTSGCGGGTESFSIAYGEIKAYDISCPGQVKTSVRVINSTGDGLTFSLAGPTQGSWPVAAGQTYNQDVLPGDYHIEVSTRCGGSSANFSVRDGERLIFEPTCQASAGATIRVNNRTGGDLHVSLAGPTPGSWTVADGQQLDQPVVPGSYRIDVSAGCGTGSDNFTVAAGETKEVTYTCNDLQPPSSTATIRVTNNTGGTLSFSLSGPTTGTWSVGNGATLPVNIAAGQYTMSVSARCGSTTERFSIGSHEVRDFRYTCQ
jgi:hypothetical protein